MDIDEKKLFTLPAQKVDGKKANSGVIREKRLIHYFVGEFETKLGDRLLALPQYTMPLSRFQYFIGPVKPSLYYVSLAGSVVGLSTDPSFVAKEESPVNEVDSSSPFPEAPYIPPLLNRLPICLNMGVGIVYSIDLKRNLITLITPLDKKEMESVNTIIVGKQPVPQALMENVQLCWFSHE